VHKATKEQSIRFVEKAGHPLSEVLSIFFMSSKLLQQLTGDFPLQVVYLILQWVG